MKLTNKQLRQIIKEELETVLDEGFLDSAMDYGKKAFGFGAEPDKEPAAEPGNQMKQEAKEHLVQYYNNYIKAEAPPSGSERMNFVRDWLGGWKEPKKREWTRWWPLYNAWRTSATGPKGISPEELIPLTVEALTPVVVEILKDSNASKYYHEANVRKFLEDAHTYGKPS